MKAGAPSGPTGPPGRVLSPLKRMKGPEIRPEADPVPDTNADANRCHLH